MILDIQTADIDGDDFLTTAGRLPLIAWSRNPDGFENLRTISNTTRAYSLVTDVD